MKLVVMLIAVVNFQKAVTNTSQNEALNADTLFISFPNKSGATVTHGPSKELRKFSTSLTARRIPLLFNADLYNSF